MSIHCCHAYPCPVCAPRCPCCGHLTPHQWYGPVPRPVPYWPVVYPVVTRAVSALDQARGIIAA